MSRFPGVFIAFEGIEGAGKSTQVALLAERLTARGHAPVLVREPGGTPLAEAARNLVLHGPADVPPPAELFLYLVARADLVARVIRPALEAGKVLLADRFEMSTRAYQVGGRGLPEEPVRSAIGLAIGDVRPDLYLVLDLPVARGRERQAAQGKAPDRLERAEDAFHQRVAEAFRREQGPEVVHLDAAADAAALHQAVWRVVVERFPRLA